MTWSQNSASRLPRSPSWYYQRCYIYIYTVSTRSNAPSAGGTFEAISDTCLIDKSPSNRLILSFFLSFLRHDGAPRRDTASRQIVVTLHIESSSISRAPSLRVRLGPIVSACNSFSNANAMEIKLVLGWLAIQVISDLVLGCIGIVSRFEATRGSWNIIGENFEICITNDAFILGLKCFM